MTSSSFDFDGQPATVCVEPGDVKNRKPTIQAIRPELVAELRMWLQEAGFAPDEPLWPKLTARTAKMLRRDLDAAEIPYVDEAGLYADFHALRHSYISLITAGGVHPKIAQRLARHSDINLTMTRYSHTLLEDEAKGLETLPRFPSVFDGAREAERAVLRATGTDAPDATRRDAEPTREAVLPLCLPRKESSDRTDVQLCAVNESDEPDVPDGVSVARKTPKTPEKSAEEASEDALMKQEGESTPGRIRTCNPRFRRPMRYPVAPRARVL